MTPKQRKAMLFIQDYVDEHGVPPTYVEIAAHVGRCSKGGVHRLVHGLRERGYLRVHANCARGIEIVQRVTPVYAAFVFDDVTKEMRRM